MIFVNGVKAQKLDQDKVDHLKKVFPRFFDETSPKPITIKFTEPNMKKAVRGIPGGRQTSIYLRSPEPRGIKTIIEGVPNEHGTFDQIVYATATPKIIDGHIKWGQEARLTLSHCMNLFPKKDLEKLYFLYFYTRQFVNGYVPNAVGQFVFELPENLAEQRIASAKNRARLESEILIGGKNYDTIKKCLEALNLSVDGNENIDRTVLYDHLNAHPNHIETYNSVTRGSGEMANAMKLVQEALEKGALICDEEGWKTVGKTGAGKVIVPPSPTDKEIVFAKFVAENDDVAARIKNAIEKASVLS